MCNVADRRPSRRLRWRSSRSPRYERRNQPVHRLQSSRSIVATTWRPWPSLRWTLTSWCGLAKKRALYRTPEQQPGRGRPRLHGEPFRLADETTHGQPQSSTHLDHPAYGAVTIDVWTDLHVAGAPDAPFSVVRVQVERLPNKKLPPRPLWLAWIGGPLPADLSVVWRWYLRRFTVEHAFR